VEKLVLEQSAAKGVTRRAISDQEILERCIYPMINEGAKILEEGKAYRASDIDIVWLNGYGFPAYRGGPMFYADTVGLKVVIEKLREQGHAPAALLEKLAGEGKGFTGW
jgi:3-hydroxyacyl-CoA dehydrogenase